MNSFAFFDRWERWYPDAPPIGYLLRERHPEYWLRVYSLPGGQRYPRNSNDWAELLHRQFSTADAVLGPSSACVLVAGYLRGSAEGRAFAARYQLEELTLLKSFPLGDDFDSDDGPIDLWAAAQTWEPETFEPALRKRAEDLAPPFLLVAETTGNVFAPYDGGVDVFTPDAGMRNVIRSRLRPWLSPRRDGL